MIEKPRFIYSSSPDRGLDTLLYLWKFIKERIPEAELKIFYGFSNWEASIRNGTVDQSSIDMYHRIMNIIQQPGVFNIGPISQEQLAKEWKDADIWLYPTRFLETFCITALEAQLSDTVVITSDLAGLQTTVGDRGILIPGDAYTKEYREQALHETLSILQDDDRRRHLTNKARQWAQLQTWENRAKQWANVFSL